MTISSKESKEAVEAATTEALDKPKQPNENPAQIDEAKTLPVRDSETGEVVNQIEITKDPLNGNTIVTNPLTNE